MAPYNKAKALVHGSKQSFMKAGIIIGVSLILVVINFLPDLYSPTLFLIKAAIQPITAALFVCLFGYSAMQGNKRVFTAVSIGLLMNAPFLLPKISFGSSHAGSYHANTNEHSILIATLSTLTRTKNIDDIASFVNTQKPDVLCLQELAKPQRTELLALLDGHYSYIIQTDNGNHLTLSNLPLIQVSADSHMQVSKLIHPEWGEVDLLNTHMPRPYKTTTMPKSWLSLLDRTSTSSKTIICGDLNITPNNTLYDILVHDYGLVDALKFGYGFTFPSAQRRSALLGPLIRIDYIFSKNLGSSDTKTINGSRFSDHRAVMTRIQS